MDSHGAAWGRTAGSQPGQQPSTEAVYRCNYWQDHAVGASGAGWECVRAQARLRDRATQLEMPPREILVSTPDPTPKNIPFHIQRGIYHLFRDMQTHLEMTQKP